MIIRNMPQNARPVFIAEAPAMTPERVIQTGKAFGQKVGTREAKAISSLLRGWRN